MVGGLACQADDRPSVAVNLAETLSADNCFTNRMIGERGLRGEVFMITTVDVHTQLLDLMDAVPLQSNRDA
jgi:hypothetical protein